MSVVHLKIAEAAKLIGVSASTLRLWESQGLISPERTLSGQRIYNVTLIEQLKYIYWQRTEKGLNGAGIIAGMRDNSILSKNDNKKQKQPNNEIHLGQKIRILRKKINKTLNDVSKDTGISASIISTFERNSQGISFSSLHALARYFGTTIAELNGVDTEKKSISLVRDKTWPVWPQTSPGVVIQMLTRGHFEMECHRFQLAPGASSEGTYQHEGEEFLFVLSGALTITFEQNLIYKLKAGDSFYFESQQPHSWKNSNDGETVVIWINTPPTF